ncbi:MAG: hypothetical protein LUF33_02255 [Clostridiales bacterium]|nr:hypothetical protein [Clostridiales bacterium]
MENLLVNPDTGQEYENVPVKVAAKFLDVAPTQIYEGLQQGRLPYGCGVKGKGGRWTYCIPCERLKAFRNGVDIDALKQTLNSLIAKTN